MAAPQDSRAWLAAALAVAVAVIAAAGLNPAARPIEVRLNGEILGHGLAVTARQGTLEWLRVADLQRAVDGSVAPNGRLRHSGGSLHARAVGGCAGCPVRVVRAVVISSRVGTLQREAHVPLEDVARAFEARVSHDTERTVYSLHVGECGWCVLEPRGNGSRDSGGRPTSP
jgi:hypothetical protein